MKNEALQDTDQGITVPAPAAVLYGVWINGETLVQKWISPNILSVMGYEVDECISEPGWWSNHVHPDDWAEVSDAIPKLISQGQHVFEYRFLHKNGSYLLIRDEAWVVSRSSEQTIEVNGAWTSILERGRAAQEIRLAREKLEKRVEKRTTELGLANRKLQAEIVERKRTERELRASEANLRSLLDNSPIFIALKDLEGRYLEINKFAAETWGPAVEEIVGKTVYEFLPKDVADILREGEREVIETGRTVETEVRIPLLTGVRPFLDVKFPIMDSERGCVGTGVIAFDLTERKLMEERLAQAQKMEAIGHLTGGIAHEFNNISHAILGYLGVLGDRLGEGNQHVELVRKIEAVVEHGVKITDSLLSFARKHPLQPVALDLVSVVSEAIQIVRAAKNSEIKITTLLPDGLARPVTDPTLAKTAVINLALNALDAMPEGGTLTIEAGNIHIDGEMALQRSQLGEDTSVMPGDYVVLAVTDSGIGISDEDLNRVFEPFFTTKEVGKGTGLGLSMVYGFAKQSNGFMAIESEIGRGTRVEIYLPVGGQEELSGIVP